MSLSCSLRKETPKKRFKIHPKHQRQQPPVPFTTFFISFAGPSRAILFGRTLAMVFSSTRMPSFLSAILSFLLLATSIQGLKFELHAGPQGQERCMRNFVAKDTLVVVTSTVSGSQDDGMAVNIRV
jgi:hypothetical protein